MYRSLKRGCDFSAACLGLVLSAPLQVVIAVLVRCKLGRPILFRQLRPGLHGQAFNLVKFRTMLEQPSGTPEISDAERLTPFGVFLRSTSLDELPTLWNVLRGDMSLVGPRPLLMVYLTRYSPRQARRHLVRPGITGLAQVRGRNALTWEEKFTADIEYVDNMGPRLDLWIMISTVWSVLRRVGVNAPGDDTMPEFFPSANRAVCSSADKPAREW